MEYSDSLLKDMASRLYKQQKQVQSNVHALASIFSLDLQNL